MRFYFTSNTQETGGRKYLIDWYFLAMNYKILQLNKMQEEFVTPIKCIKFTDLVKIEKLHLSWHTSAIKKLICHSKIIHTYLVTMRARKLMKVFFYKKRKF